MGGSKNDHGNDDTGDDDLFPPLEPFEFKRSPPSKEITGSEITSEQGPDPKGGIGNQKAAVAEAKAKGNPAQQKVVINKGIDLDSGSGDAGSSKTGTDDKTWSANFLTKLSLKAGVITAAPDGSALEVTAVKAEAEVSAFHTEFDLLGGDDVEFETKVIAGLEPQAARIGDPTSHGMLAGVGSADTLAENLPIWRGLVDLHTCPLATGPLPHGSGLAMPAETHVLINGFRAVRAGDPVVEAGGGPNPIMAGAPTVLIGVSAPPVTAKVPIPKAPDDSWIQFDLIAVGDAGNVKAEAVAGAGYDKDGGKVSGVLGVGAALFKGQLTGKVTISPDWAPFKLVVGGTGEAMVGGKAEGNAQVLVNQVDPKTKKKKYLSASAGVKVAVGAGGGLKLGFSLEEK